MVYQDMMNTQTCIRFLRRLIKDTGQKIFLILDNLKVHHSKIVKKWVRAPGRNRTILLALISTGIESG